MTKEQIIEEAKSLGYNLIFTSISHQLMGGGYKVRSITNGEFDSFIRFSDLNGNIIINDVDVWRDDSDTIPNYLNIIQNNSKDLFLLKIENLISNWIDPHPITGYTNPKYLINKTDINGISIPNVYGINREIYRTFSSLRPVIDIIN